MLLLREAACMVQYVAVMVVFSKESACLRTNFEVFKAVKYQIFKDYKYF